MPAPGQFETENHVRDDSSFSQKRLPAAADGCAAGHCSTGLAIDAELAPIADAGAGGRDESCGPIPDYD
jgi:hypothetical protein